MANESFGISAVLEFILKGQENVAKASESLIKAAEDAKEASEKSEEASEKLSGTSANLQLVASNLLQIGDRLTHAGEQIASALTKVVERGLEFSGSLAEMADKTGIGVAALDNLAFAAASTGKSMEQLLPAINIMSRGIFDAEQGTGRAKDSFKLLGLSMDELKGHSPDEQLRIITDKLQGVSDANERTKITMDVFGRSGVEAIAPLIGKMDEFAKANADSAHETAEQAEAAQHLNEVLGGVGYQVQKLYAIIAGDLLPIITPIANAISTVVIGFQHLAEANPVIIYVVGAVAALVAGTLLLAGGIILLAGFALALAGSLSVLRGAITGSTTGLWGMATAGLRGALGLTSVAGAADAAAVSLGAADVAAGAADVAVGGIGVAATASLPGIAAMGAALWASLAPILPIVLAIGAGLAIMAGMAYLAYRYVNAEPNVPHPDMSSGGSGSSVSQSSISTGSVHEYNVRIRHEKGDNNQTNQQIKDQIDQFARKLGGSSAFAGS